MIDLPATAQNIIDTLIKHDFVAYAVGGSVRDTILGIETHGWDFTTNATPEEILKIFPESFYDNTFGTVGIKIYPPSSRTDGISEDEIQKPIDIYEITTFRTEKDYTDNRHPDTIAWGKTIDEDLSRRDFTINAIATDGKIMIDPFAGQQDLGNKLVRAVGNATDRFHEDALRQMRAVRIAAQLGFMIETETRKAIEQYSHLISKISFERIRDELFKILSAKYAADGILLLKNTSILKHILPELELCFHVEQKSPKRHHIFDVGTHSVEALKTCPSVDPVVQFATLLHDIGKPKTMKVDPSGVITFYNHEVVGARMAKTIAARFRLSRAQSEKLYTLVRWHQFSVDERQTDSAIRRIIRKIGKENLEDMLSLRIGDRLGGGALETSWRLELFKKRLTDVQKQPFSVSDLKINGHDVMKKLDAKPGPIVGKVLGLLFAEVEKGKLANDREILLSKIKEVSKNNN